MGHVIFLSELERAKPARLRGPLPKGGATVSLFLGVRYERAVTEHEAATLVASPSATIDANELADEAQLDPEAHA